RRGAAPGRESSGEADRVFLARGPMVCSIEYPSVTEPNLSRRPSVSKGTAPAGTAPLQEAFEGVPARSQPREFARNGSRSRFTKLLVFNRAAIPSLCEGERRCLGV